MAGAVNITFGVIPTPFTSGLGQMGASVAQFTTRTRAQFDSLKTISNGPIGSLSNLGAQLGATNKNLNPLLSNLGKLGGLGPQLSPLTTAVGGLFAVDKVLGFGKAITDTSGKFEKYGSVLRNALQSGSGARDQLRGLTDFAATTPNQLDELTGSFIKLVNRGLIPSREQLTNFGDLAASQGKGFDQLTEAILDAQSGEFERLKEFGVRASKSGDQVTLSFKGVSQTVSNTNEAITGAIQKFGQLTGVAGSMSAVAQTQEGLVSNLGDAYDRLLVALGEAGISGTFKQAVSAASSFLGVITDLVANSPAEDLRKQQTELNSLVGAIALANDNETVRLSLIQKLNQNYPEFLGKLNAEAVSADILSKRLADVNAQYDRKIRIALGEEKIKKATEEVTAAVKQQQDALELLARASGKSITELEKLDQKGRIRLAKQLADPQQFVNTGAGTIPVFNRVTALPTDLIEGAERQKKAQAELNKLMQDNSVRQADLTKTTVDGYRAQIDQIQQKIKLHQIDARLGADEIKRINDQIRLTQGLAPVVSKTPTSAAPDKAGPSVKLNDNTIVALLKRVEQDLERQIQGLSKQEIAIQIKAANNNDPNSLFVRLRAVQTELAAVESVVKRAQELADAKPVDLGKLVTLNLPKLQGISPELVNLPNASAIGVAYATAVNGVRLGQKALADAMKQDSSSGGPQLPYLDKFFKQVQEAREKFADEKEQLMNALGIAKEQLAAAGIGLLAGIGDSIGKGENPLKGFLRTIVGFIADFTIKLGTALLLSGKLEEGAAALSGPFGFLFALQGAGKIAAGAALVVGGASIKSIGSFEGGGLFKGTSLIRVGESAKALAGGGEFVAPVALGADLISARIMDNLRLDSLTKGLNMRMNTPDFSKTQFQRQTVQVNLNGGFEFDGRMIRLVLDQHDYESSYYK